VQLPACHARVEKPELLIVDSKRLRQAAIMRLLEAWADAMGITVKAVIPDAPLDADYASANCEMIILSVGGASIQDAQQNILIDTVRRLMPHASLVIISDREDPQEVCAAFQQGAIGFMPTSIEPALAFQALSFIRSGGSSFPPSVLSTYLGEVTVHRPVRDSDLTIKQEENRPVRDSDLTIKQEEVFGLLRQGFSNKVIARRLGMSEATVKVHVRRIIHKFGVANRTQVAIATMNQSSLRVAVNGKELFENGDAQRSAF
jgi:DNA-binding NarL/FixJ family response regulator